VFPDPIVGAKTFEKEKVNLLELESKLPKEVFDALFEKKTVVEVRDNANGYQRKLIELSEEHQNLLRDYVEVVESTPRVNSCGDDVKELDSLCNKCEESVKNFLDDSEERNRRVK